MQQPADHVEAKIDDKKNRDECAAFQNQWR